MKRNALGLLAALSLAAFAAPAQGGTYLNVDCYCNPKTEGNTLKWPDGSTHYGCVCIQNYTLGKSSTKEFRFRCKSANAWNLGQDERVADLDGATTCTSPIDLEKANAFGVDYGAQSCTNWSSLSTDTLTLQVFCPLKE